ncbi:hypothetical protein BDV96DRAFT_286500 [Lophiotrema nucula]|uniref:Uncharacterized protein n=1 Tax=Lophiotrema nucula TaxID=690887 RepID=A0A6A5YMS1_9PLEO|nr:hypothetical protein BDV96DRAFT_286500 [Lophiotrema nucula]
MDCICVAFKSLARAAVPVPNGLKDRILMGFEPVVSSQFPKSNIQPDNVDKAHPTVASRCAENENRPWMTGASCPAVWCCSICNDGSTYAQGPGTSSEANYSRILIYGLHGEVGIAKVIFRYEPIAVIKRGLEPVATLAGPISGQDDQRGSGEPRLGKNSRPREKTDSVVQ